jgi:hypothetical protein
MISATRRSCPPGRSPLRPSFALAALIAFAPSCGGDRTPTSAPPAPQPLKSDVASVSIDQLKGFFGIKLDVGEQASLTATVRDASGAVLVGHAITWSSSSPSVATVSSTGTVTGAGTGTATIAATSDGKTDTRTVQVLALNLTAFQLTVFVTDDAGKPVPGASVENVYYGARPADCLVCNIPYGNYVSGTTDNAGSFTGRFVADPEAMDSWAVAVHAFAYVVASSPNFETDRRFVIGTTPPFAQPLHLHAMREVAAGDSVSLTIASTDPVFQALDTSPAEFGTTVCRSVRVRAATDGVLSVNAVPVGSGLAPLVELDKADESDLIAFGTGGVSQSVHAGDVLEIRIATTIRPGEPSQSFVLHTALAR